MTLVRALLVTSLLVACKKEEAAPAPVKEPPKKGETDPHAKPPPVVETKPMEQADPIRVDGFHTPESVLHDEQTDLYLVSNINGSPTDKDNNGFISQLAPDGKIVALKWIDGAGGKLTLHAPKGMAFVGDTLYVTDIDVVRMFDRKTGAAKGEIAFPGASFMNDLAAAGDVLYATDSGLRPDFSNSGTAAVYKITGGKAEKIAAGDELKGPNGVFFTDRLYVVSFTANELFEIGPDGKPANPHKLPKGGLDGLLVLPDGTFLVTSWEERAVFAGKPGPDGKFEAKITNVKSPADLGWDAKRSRVLIPLFEEKAVIIHPW